MQVLSGLVGGASTWRVPFLVIGCSGLGSLAFVFFMAEEPQRGKSPRATNSLLLVPCLA